MDTAQLALDMVNGEITAIIDAIAPYATSDETVIMPDCQPCASVRFIHAGRIVIMWRADRHTGDAQARLHTFSTAWMAHAAYGEMIEDIRQAVAGHTHAHGVQPGMDPMIVAIANALGIDPTTIDVRATVVDPQAPPPFGFTV